MAAAILRLAKYGDGWMYLNHGPGDDALRDFDTLRKAWAKEDRGGEPELCVRLSAGSGTPEDWRRSVAAHLQAMIRYHEAVGDLF